MQRKNFMEDEAVYKAYDRWINSPTLFGHIMDREYFYKFVNQCVEYVKYMKFVKRKKAWKSIDMNVLKEHLCKSFSELKEENCLAYEERVHDILVKFEMLIEYEKSKDKLLESYNYE